jgi:cytoskeletal protein CcmA (bactofilin family)
MVGRLLAVATLSLLFALSLIGTARAAETKSGDSVSVPAGQTIQGDLHVAGQDVSIAGTINGDLIGFAQHVTISGTVNGSVNLAAQDIEISGTVNNSVRAAGKSVTVSGSVHGDLAVAADSITITSTGEVNGDVLVGSGDLRVAGPVGRDIRGSVSDLIVDSRVGQDVRVSADSISLTGKARIGGDLRYSSGKAAVSAPGGRVSGQTVRASQYWFAGGPDIWSAITSHIVRTLLMLVTGLFVILFIPRASIAAADAIRIQLLASALTGLLSFILWPVLAVIFAVVIVGIPIALVGTVLLLCFAYLSQVFVGLAIGRVILPGSWRIGSRGFNILAMAIGVILIGLIRMIPAPVVSPLVALIVAILGVGGILTALRNAHSSVPG